MSCDDRFKYRKYCYRFLYNLTQYNTVLFPLPKELHAPSEEKSSKPLISVEKSDAIAEKFFTIQAMNETNNAVATSVKYLANAEKVLTFMENKARGDKKKIKDSHTVYKSGTCIICPSFSKYSQEKFHGKLCYDDVIEGNCQRRGCGSAQSCWIHLPDMRSFNIKTLVEEREKRLAAVAEFKTMGPFTWTLIKNWRKSVRKSNRSASTNICWIHYLTGVCGANASAYMGCRYNHDIVETPALSQLKKEWQEQETNALWLESVQKDWRHPSEMLEWESKVNRMCKSSTWIKKHGRRKNRICREHFTIERCRFGRNCRRIHQGEYGIQLPVNVREAFDKLNRYKLEKHNNGVKVLPDKFPITIEKTLIDESRCHAQDVVTRMEQEKKAAKDAAKDAAKEEKNRLKIEMLEFEQPKPRWQHKSYRNDGWGSNACVNKTVFDDEDEDTVSEEQHDAIPLPEIKVGELVTYNNEQVRIEGILPDLGEISIQHESGVFQIVKNGTKRTVSEKNPRNDPKGVG